MSYVWKGEKEASSLHKSYVDVKGQITGVRALLPHGGFRDWIHVSQSLELTEKFFTCWAILLNQVQLSLRRLVEMSWNIPYFFCPFDIIIHCSGYHFLLLTSFKWRSLLFCTITSTRDRQFSCGLGLPVL